MNVHDIITISEFRKNTKLFLDTAKDTPVYVRRGDDVFEIKLSGGLKLAPVFDANQEFIVQTKRDDEDYRLVPPVAQKPKESPAPFVPKAPDPQIGYPCCQLTRPCKHWAFDGVDGVWKNELTGATKEV